MSNSWSLDYKASPTAVAFHKSNAYVRGIMGPVGSGKSTACIVEMFIRGSQQAKAPDGKRYTRWLVVRNTYGELLNTTIKTWDEWFPPHIFGKRGAVPPYRQTIEVGDMHMEVIFMALDGLDDIQKLKSFEPTGIFYNEARYIPFELVSAAVGRLGRYPGNKLGGTTWSGIIMDTNPPPDTHWWYKMAEARDWLRDPKTGELRDESEISDDMRWEFFKQPSGLSDEAENLENLMQTPETIKLSLEERRKHGRKYYERQCMGQTKEWINVEVHGNYGTVTDGKAVFEGWWDEDIHVASGGINKMPRGQTVVGLDCSGRNPAAVFLQRHGEYVCVTDEMLMEDASAEDFADALKLFVHRHYKDCDLRYYGDPAGGHKSFDTGRTYFEVLRTRGIVVTPAMDALRFEPRKQAAIKILQDRTSGGDAVLKVAPGCSWLRRGMNGAYFYKKQKHSSGIDYKLEPEKRGNRSADVMDAWFYGLSGLGAIKSLRGRNRGLIATIAKWDFMP